MRSETLALLGAWVLAACSTTPPTDPAAADASIRALFANGGAAWNRGDLDGYLATYARTDDVRWISGGDVVVGYDAIAERTRARFGSPDAMGTLTVEDLDVRLIDERNALVLGHWTHAAGGRTQHGVFTVLVRLQDGAWAVVHDHSSRIDGDPREDG